MAKKSPFSINFTFCKIHCFFFVILSSLFSCSKDLPQIKEEIPNITISSNGIDLEVLQTLRTNEQFIELTNFYDVRNWTEAIVNLRNSHSTDSLYHLAVNKYLDSINILYKPKIESLESQYKCNIKSYILHEHVNSFKGFNLKSKSSGDVDIYGSYWWSEKIYASVRNAIIDRYRNDAYNAEKCSVCEKMGFYDLPNDYYVRFAAECLQMYFYQSYGGGYDDNKPGKLIDILREATNDFNAPPSYSVIRMNNLFLSCLTQDAYYFVESESILYFNMYAYFFHFETCYQHKCQNCGVPNIVGHDCYTHKECGDDYCLRCKGCLKPSLSTCTPCVCGYNCSHPSCSKCGKCLGNNIYGCMPCDCPCDDTKCRACEGCISPSKSNCRKCVCVCEHTRCRSCEKYIRKPATRSSALPYMCESHSYCESAGPVCECGERHLENGKPKCQKKYIGVLYENKTTGYEQMWSWTKKNNKECAGYLLVNNWMVASYSEDNEPTSSGTIGYYYECINGIGKYCAVLSSTEYLSIEIANSVHTHRKEDVNLSHIMVETSILAQYLSFSRDKDLANLKVPPGSLAGYGYLLCDGYVFKYTADMIERNLHCPIIDRFKVD